MTSPSLSGSLLSLSPFPFPLGLRQCFARVYLYAVANCGVKKLFSQLRSISRLTSEHETGKCRECGREGMESNKCFRARLSQLGFNEKCKRRSEARWGVGNCQLYLPSRRHKIECKIISQAAQQLSASLSVEIEAILNRNLSWDSVLACFST